MKKIFFILLMLTTSLFAQKSVNNYKYVIIPTKFDFVNSPDKYQTSSLTKFLFNKHGFKAFLADEKLLKDLAINRCLALTGDVKSKSSLIRTKTTIELRDCQNNIIFTSEIGKSRHKDYKKSYHEAIRDAFKSIARLNYTYKEIASATSKIPNVKVSEKEVVIKKVVVPVVVKKPDVRIIEKPVSVKNAMTTLYAQVTKNGFQLVDTKPVVIFKLFKTNVKDVFIIKDKNGLLYKNKNIWIAEFYENDVRKTIEYQIKF